MITTVAMGAGGNAVAMIMGVWPLGHVTSSLKYKARPTMPPTW